MEGSDSHRQEPRRAHTQSPLSTSRRRGGVVIERSENTSPDISLRRAAVGVASRRSPAASRSRSNSRKPDSQSSRRLAVTGIPSSSRLSEVRTDVVPNQGSREGVDQSQLAPQSFGSHQPSDDSIEKAARREAFEKFRGHNTTVLNLRMGMDQQWRKYRLKRQDVSRNVITVQEAIQSEQQSLPAALNKLLQSFSELQNMETGMDLAQQQLVSAETTLQELCPRLLGSTASKTFEGIHDHEFPSSSENDADHSDRGDPGQEAERSPEERKLDAKRDEIEFLEEKYMEMRQDKVKFENILDEGGQLDADDAAFLDNYNRGRAQLMDELNAAQLELENLREECGKSEGLHALLGIAANIPLSGHEYIEYAITEADLS